MASAQLAVPMCLRSLGLDLAILLDMDVLVRLEDANLIIRELDAEDDVSHVWKGTTGQGVVREAFD